MHTEYLYLYSTCSERNTCAVRGGSLRLVVGSQSTVMWFVGNQQSVLRWDGFLRRLRSWPVIRSPWRLGPDGIGPAQQLERREWGVRVTLP